MFEIKHWTPTAYNYLIYGGVVTRSLLAIGRRRNVYVLKLVLYYHKIVFCSVVNDFHYCYDHNLL